MNLEFTPLKVILLMILAATGGIIGGQHIAAQVQQVQEIKENSFEDQIRANVIQVDNEIQALKLAYNNSSVGYFRADCQNTQQYITEKYLVAGRDSGFSQEDRRLNGEYKAFLVEANNIIDIYLKRSNPDFTRYEYLRDKILK
jgi:hypothetical protein